MKRFYGYIALGMGVALWVVPITLAQAPDFTDKAEIIPLNRSTNAATHADGDVKYDATKKEYYVAGNGWDIQEDGDECFFVYKKISGSFRIEAEVEWVGGPHEWSKAGLMCRQTTDGNSVQTNIITSGVAGQEAPDRVEEGSRLTTGSGYSTSWTYLPDEMFSLPTRLAIIRIAASNTFIRQYYNTVTKEWVSYIRAIPAMPEEILVGLAATSHVDDDNSWAEALFRNIKIEVIAGVAVATRVLPDVIYVAGKPVNVSIDIEGEAGSFTLVETPPTGWAISAVSDSGTVANGVITWTLTFVGGKQTVTYVVTPPSGTTADGKFSGKLGDLDLVGPTTMVTAKPLGIFENHMDIGGVAVPGDATYNSTSKEYQITASGADIWDSADEFHFVYSKVSGAFSIEGQAYVMNDDGTSTWGKAEIMVRDSLDAGAMHYSGMVRTQDEYFYAQFRTSTGGGSGAADPILSTDVQDGRMKVVRSGNSLSLYYIDLDTEQWVLQDSRTVNFTDPVYVGLAVTSHDDGRYSTGFFTNVVLTVLGAVPTATRTLSRDYFQANDVVEVSIEVTNPGSAGQSATIKETIPAGWKASAISQGGSESGGVITWNNITLPPGSTLLTYTATAPAAPTAGAAWTGTIGELSIGGTTSLVFVQPALGIFEGHADIGAVGAPGSATYDSTTGQYTITASGADIWDSADEFHFVFSTVTGDFSLKANVYVEQVDGTSDWGKAQLMVRDSLQPGSMHCNIMVRTLDLQMDAQWRSSTGGGSGAASEDAVVDLLPTDLQDGQLELVREGNTIRTYYIDLGTNERTLYWTQNIAFTDPVYVGLAVTSHDDGRYSTGYFTKVELTIVPPVSVREWNFH